MLQKLWPLFVLLAAGLVALALLAPGGNTRPEPLTELVKEDEVQGTGPAARVGDAVVVHYTGRLIANGKQFDSSRGPGPGRPFKLTLGEGRVIKGWDEGLVGMKAGGKRKLKIPAELAYGRRGQPPDIPPDADLEFDVELLKVVPAE